MCKGYVTIRTKAFETLLRRVPAKEGVLFYLEAWEEEGAYAYQLLEALGCSPKTLDTALRTLIDRREIKKRGDLYVSTLPTDKR